jgi:DNA-binding transcriptional LysR family regulator
LHVDDVPSPAITSSGLRERRYDLILARLRVPLPKGHSVNDLNVEYLFDDPLVVATGRRSEWARRRKVGLAELVGAPWMLPPPGTWTYTYVAEAFRAQGLPMPQVTLATFSMHIRAHFLSTGRFLTAEPRSVADRYALKILPVDLPVRSFRVAVVTLKGRILSPVVERFIECARELAPSMDCRSQARRRK